MNFNIREVVPRDTDPACEAAFNDPVLFNGRVNIGPTADKHNLSRNVFVWWMIEHKKIVWRKLGQS